MQALASLTRLLLDFPCLRIKGSGKTIEVLYVNRDAEIRKAKKSRLDTTPRLTKKRENKRKADAKNNLFDSIKIKCRHHRGVLEGFQDVKNAVEVARLEGS
jgi:hypothetical protein